MSGERNLDCQIAVRVHPSLLMALRSDAAENGRTVAQTVRFLLTRALQEVTT